MPLKSRLHSSKIKIPLGYWEIPNDNISAEYCILSHVKEIDQALKGYVQNVGYELKQNSSQRTVNFLDTSGFYYGPFLESFLLIKNTPFRPKGS